MNYHQYQDNKRIKITNDLHPSNTQAAVSFYQCTPYSRIKRFYVRFYLPGGMFNWWLLYLNEITAKPTPEKRQEFYNLWTGIVPIQNPEYQHLWSPIHGLLIEIYDNFHETFHPQVPLQTLLKDFLTSEDGFLKFYLTFIGQYRANNFFPTSSDYTEFNQQQTCREEGCFFQIPIIVNFYADHVFDVGPTLNIIPDNENNTYLKNYWRSVVIISHKIVRNIASVVTLIGTPQQQQQLYVKNVITTIIRSIKRLLNIGDQEFPRIEIPKQYYNDEIPFFMGLDPRTFLEIHFNYWVTSECLYQNQLKVNLVWTRLRT